MADKTETSTEEAAAKAPAARVPMLPLLLTMLVAVVLGGGAVIGAGWYLLRSGKLPVVQGASEQQAVAVPVVKTRLMAMEPMLVNLADPDGRSYLRLSATLRVEDAPLAKGEKPKEEKAEKGKPAPEDQAALRDAALAVLGHQSSADLLAEGGKDQLKSKLLASFNEHVPDPRVKEVLFTEFLVQR